MSPIAGLDGDLLVIGMDDLDRDMAMALATVNGATIACPSVVDPEGAIPRDDRPSVPPIPRGARRKLLVSGCWDIRLGTSV
ncbi:MAG TPA: hypothetical protein VGV37_03170 [Aliidongia sp.]|uniref:hypothetical protein n=1 Tax=Aliidongia sp. TaxID=1914230 RepID=UPI002DDCA6B3|nr:hypothetical protein [Aliidongia sp.]HEV2673515.1 hypothetical protein [Aliidongia sp.]